MKKAADGRSISPRHSHSNGVTPAINHRAWIRTSNHIAARRRGWFEPRCSPCFRAPRRQRWRPIWNCRSTASKVRSRTPPSPQRDMQDYASRDVTAAQAHRLFDRAPANIAAALEPYGYYNATADGELKETPTGFVAIIHVHVGEPTTVATFDVTSRSRRATRKSCARRSPHSRRREANVSIMSITKRAKPRFSPLCWRPVTSTRS